MPPPTRLTVQALDQWDKISIYMEASFRDYTWFYLDMIVNSSWFTLFLQQLLVKAVYVCVCACV